jgi:hypothetical protein
MKIAFGNCNWLSKTRGLLIKNHELCSRAALLFLYGLSQVQATVLEFMRLMRPLPLTQSELALASALLLSKGVRRKAKKIRCCL